MEDVMLDHLTSEGYTVHFQAGSVSASRDEEFWTAATLTELYQMLTVWIP